VETSAQAGPSARGIGSHDAAMIESAKGARVRGRRCRGEVTADARMAEVGVTSKGTTDLRVPQRRRSAVRVTVIVEPPAVTVETRAA
jgi:hypothetical protein